MRFPVFITLPFALTSVYRLGMANEALVSVIKSIMRLGKEGKVEEAYLGYRNLFEDPEFLTHRPEDQRQSLRLMILAKGLPHNPGEAIVEAHRAAIPPLKHLVALFEEPADYELLGMCYAVTGDVRMADSTFRTGLNIERQRNAGSDLCGTLMKRISLL